MKVDQLAEGLDGGEHARDDIATLQLLPIDLDGGEPGGAGQFAQLTTVVATEDAQTLGEYKSP